MKKTSKIHEKFYILNSFCCLFSLGTFRINVFKLSCSYKGQRFILLKEWQVAAQTKQLMFEEKIQNLPWDRGKAEQG